MAVRIDLTKVSGSDLVQITPVTPAPIILKFRDPRSIEFDFDDVSSPKRVHVMAHGYIDFWYNIAEITFGGAAITTKAGFLTAVAVIRPAP